jgi:hypothetical protein
MRASLFLTLTMMTVSQEPSNWPAVPYEDKNWDSIPNEANGWMDYPVTQESRGTNELTVDFGKFKYLSDMQPGTFFWSETQQKSYLLLSGGRFCDPRTGEQWEYESKACGFVIQGKIKPNSLDIRPWVSPQRENMPSVLSK